MCVENLYMGDIMKLFKYLALIVFISVNSYSQFIQQGGKLASPDVIGPYHQGNSVAVSSDGNIAVIGVHADNDGIGAVLVYARTNGVWNQIQKLTVTDYIDLPFFGTSVSISADGNTILVGGKLDDVSVGAAWVFARENNIWIKKQKLVGTGIINAALQGGSCAISADGNTAVVGGYTDNFNIGACWVFVKTNGIWLQQAKLVGTGNIGISGQGRSVAISADGNIVVTGAYLDNGSRGAAWVFTRTNGTWSQAQKLVGTDKIGLPKQGISSAITPDGKTIISGGYEDNGLIGAAWIFKRGTDGIWVQQQKLVGTGVLGPIAELGSSVSISGDGNTAIIGGMTDNLNIGAVWVFNQVNGVWNQTSKLTGSGNIGGGQFGTSSAISDDGHTILSGAPYDNFSKGAGWVFNLPSSDGSGEMTINPNSAYINTAVPAFDLTYSVATGGITNGEIEIIIPQGWVIGSVSSSQGNAAIINGIIRITNITIDGGSKLFITLSNTTTGSTPGANLFYVSEKSTAAGSLLPLTSNPSVYLNLLQSNNGYYTLTYPVGGENLKAGTYKYIEWKRVGIIMGGLLLEYSTDNGKTWTAINTAPVAGISRYAWLVPNCNSNNCRIRLSNFLTRKVYTETANTFSILTSSCQVRSYPNPFNPVTKISFPVEKGEIVSLKIYNNLGQEVKELLNKELPVGLYEYEFNASTLPSGVYFYNLTRGGVSEVHKLLLMK